MHFVDKVISPKWMLPIKGKKLLENHSIVIDGGLIKDIGVTEKIKKNYKANEVLILDEHLIMPGLINSHTHSPMSLLKGVVKNDLPLDLWLKQIWKYEEKYIDREFIEIGTTLSIVEMIRNGITSFSDMYVYPETTIECVLKSGMRATIGLPIANIKTSWADNEKTCLKKSLSVYDEYNSEPNINFSFAPHAIYTVSKDMFKKISQLSNELMLPIQMHLHETEKEINDFLKKYKQRPIMFLNEINMLSKYFSGIHMTHITDDDLELIKKNKINIIHCPKSNLRLFSGVMNLKRLIRNKVNVSLGSDSSASNDKLDIFEEMKFSKLLSNMDGDHKDSLSCDEIIELGTINGAKALQIDDRVGTLEINKIADMISINCKTLACASSANLKAHLLYSNRTSDVDNMWVAGKQLLRDKKLLTLDEKLLYDRIKRWKKKKGFH